MKFHLTIDGHEHDLEWSSGRFLSCRMDGTSFDAEAIEIAPGIYSLLLNGGSFSVRVSPISQQPDLAAASPDCYSVQVDGTTYTVTLRDPRRWSGGRGTLAREGRQQITAPMSGKVVRLLVSQAQRVEPGQGVIVVEAMKMQNEIKCHAAGTVAQVLVSEGQAVSAGERLLIIE